LYIYGGYEINKTILDSFYEVYINKERDFLWKKVKYSKDNKITPGPLHRAACVKVDNCLYIYGG